MSVLETKVKIPIATTALFLCYVYAFRSSIRAVKCAFCTYCVKHIDGGRAGNEVFWLIQ